MEEIGVLGLVVGLWIALSAPKRATGIQDRLATALAWTLVALAVLLALTATLELPSDTTGLASCLVSPGFGRGSGHGVVQLGGAGLLRPQLVTPPVAAHDDRRPLI